MRKAPACEVVHRLPALIAHLVRVLGEPTRRVGSADHGSLTYVSAGANLRLEFWDEELAGIYLERTPSRAELWFCVCGSIPLWAHPVL